MKHLWVHPYPTGNILEQWTIYKTRNLLLIDLWAGLTCSSANDQQVIKKRGFHLDHKTLSDAMAGS